MFYRFDCIAGILSKNQDIKFRKEISQGTPQAAVYSFTYKSHLFFSLVAQDNLVKKAQLVFSYTKNIEEVAGISLAHLKKECPQ